MGLELGAARLDENAWCGGEHWLGSRDDDFSFLHGWLQLSEAVEVGAEKLLAAVVAEEWLLALRFLFELPLELFGLLFGALSVGGGSAEILDEGCLLVRVEFDLFAELFVRELQHIFLILTFSLLMQTQVRQKRLHRYNRFKPNLLIQLIPMHHRLQHINVARRHIPRSLRSESQGFDPVECAALKHDQVARPLVERDHFELVPETPVNICEPEAFVFEKVEIIGFLRLCSELLNVFLGADAVPESTGRSVVQVGRSHC